VVGKASGIPYKVSSAFDCSGGMDEHLFFEFDLDIVQSCPNCPKW